MSMLEWAENEIRIASERERGDKPEGEWDYGVACYESALKAYKALCEDNHSGMSWGITVGILMRLCRAQPLTPIEDTPDVWNEVGENEYQCRRMSSLFKSVAEEGSVTYKDVNRILCVDVANPDISYYSGLVSRVINQLYPIKMPYVPSAPIRVYCEEFLTDKANGDFDMVGIFYLVEPDGNKVPINWFYKESGSGFAEISLEEYNQRKAVKIDR